MCNLEKPGNATSGFLRGIIKPKIFFYASRQLMVALHLVLALKSADPQLKILDMRLMSFHRRMTVCPPHRQTNHWTMSDPLLIMILSLVSVHYNGMVKYLISSSHSMPFKDAEILRSKAHISENTSELPGFLFWSGLRGVTSNLMEKPCRMCPKPLNCSAYSLLHGQL